MIDSSNFLVKGEEVINSRNARLMRCRYSRETLVKLAQVYEFADRDIQKGIEKERAMRIVLDSQGLDNWHFSSYQGQLAYRMVNGDFGGLSKLHKHAMPGDPVGKSKRADACVLYWATKGLLNRVF